MRNNMEFRTEIVKNKSFSHTLKLILHTCAERIEYCERKYSTNDGRFSLQRSKLIFKQSVKSLQTLTYFCHHRKQFWKLQTLEGKKLPAAWSVKREQKVMSFNGSNWEHRGERVYVRLKLTTRAGGGSLGALVGQQRQQWGNSPPVAASKVCSLVCLRTRQIVHTRPAKCTYSNARCRRAFTTVTLPTELRSKNWRECWNQLDSLQLSVL